MTTGKNYSNIHTALELPKMPFRYYDVYPAFAVGETTADLLLPIQKTRLQYESSLKRGWKQ
jgi:hypothetical protein